MSFAGRRAVFACVVVLAFGGIFACSSDDNITTATAPGGGSTPATTPPFTVSVQPSALLIAPGESATVTVTIASDSARSSPFTLVASRLPKGITVAPVEILGPVGTLTFAAASSAPGGVTAVVSVEALSGATHAAADLELTTTAPAPALDATFGEAGKTIVGAGVAREDLAAVALQADGKIVVAGAYRTGYTTVPAIARYLAAGTLDTTFGQGGVVLLDKHDSSSAVGLAIQADGKIVVLEPNDFTLTRLDAGGALDPTFNGTGVTSAVFPNEARGAALVVQPDGKIVVAGGAVDVEPDFALARFLADGTLDLGFGTNGRVVTAVVAGEDAATSIALETSGATTVSIVLGGTAAVGAGRSTVVARYLGTTGALDTSFDTDGIATFSSGATAEDLVAGVAVVSGAVVVSGHRRVAAATDLLQVLRFTNAGALDPTFDTDGVVTVGFPSDARAHGLLVSAGKIVVAAEVGTAAAQAALVRLDANGALDATFGTGGTITAAIDDESTARAVAVQPSDGALVIVGSATIGANADALVARFTSAGALDPTFDGDGRTTASFGPGDEELRAVAIQPDGKIVAAGSAFNGRDFDFLVARLLPTGKPDATFGGGRGHVLHDRTRSSEFAYDVRLQGDGKIVVGGQGGPGAIVLRLLPDGSPDPSFGTAGAATISGGDGYGTALQPDGRIVVAGPGAAGDFFVARLTTGGALDTSGTAAVGFGTTGTLTTDLGLGLPDRAIALAVDPAGRIVVAGHVDHGKPPNFFDLAIARYDANGALDPTFADTGRTTFDTASVELLYAVAIQPDDKILIGGRMQRPGRATSFGLFRLAASGGLDSSFGTAGRAQLDLEDGSQASAILVEPSRMILAAGRSSSDRLLLARLSPSGAPIWPAGGAVMTSFGSRAEAFALARQTDRRVVLAGVGRGKLEDQAVLVRYEP